MMEDPDFAAMRLQQVGVQIARDKRRKAAEEKRLLKEQRKIERLRKKDEKAKIKVRIVQQEVKAQNFININEDIFFSGRESKRERRKKTGKTSSLSCTCSNTC